MPGNRKGCDGKKGEEEEGGMDGDMEGGGLLSVFFDILFSVCGKTERETKTKKKIG